MAFEPTGTESGNAPIGADPVQSVPADQGDSTPKPIELKDDTYVVDPKSGKPVKYSEYNRTFQSQFTRASQEAARYKQELLNERAQREAIERANQQNRQNGPPQEGIYDRLKSLTYLSGEQAAEVVQSIGQELHKRDQILTLLTKELLNVKQIAGNLHGQSTTQQFGNKINQWVTEAGYDPKAPGMTDLAQEIYLAYTGDDLDEQFPRIFTERLKQMEAIYEARRQAAIQKARGGPFLPGGRGGNASPSRPLEIDPKANPRQIADALWHSWGSDPT